MVFHYSSKIILTPKQYEGVGVERIDELFQEKRDDTIDGRKEGE
jgi:hypothetical protein